MDIKKLNYFITIAQTGSYSEAAEKLFVSQAALSKHILSLEKELGTLLFDRSSRKIAITPEGKLLWTHALKLTESYDCLLKDLHNANNKKLTVASMPIMVQYGITRLIADFCKLHPTISLSIQELGNHNIASGLDNHNYDLAFIRRDYINTSKMDVLDIFEDQMVLIMSKQHPLCEKSVITLNEFKNDKFFFLNKETMLYDDSYAACIRAGFEPNIVFTGTRADNIAEMVSSNMGVALLMKQVACSLDKQNFAIAAIHEMPLSYISLVCLKRTGCSNAAKLLWNYVEQKCKEGFL